MTASLPVISAQSARRLLMDAQGLLEHPGRCATPAVLQAMIERMGFVQLDSINVAERAHHLTLASRFEDYRHEHLADLLERDRSLFEHWTHDASAIPVKWFAHWKPRFARNRTRILNNAWWQERIGAESERILSEVRDRIAVEGPLRSGDFEHPQRGAASSWWGWKPQKAALEFLWQTGELTVVRRVNFHKVYDLTERVLPECYQAAEPTEDEHIEWACQTAMERLVVATPKEVADFWHTITQAQARTWCETAAEGGRIMPVLVESLSNPTAKVSYAINDWERRLKKLPAPLEQMRLLCPFDPVLRDRARVQRLFGFDYRFEAFVPEPKRQYGYYVLPILEGDWLIGRVDPKFHRARGVLELRRVFWEPHVKVTRVRRRRLKEAAERLGQTIGAQRIEMPHDA